MALEIEGRIARKLNVQTGTSARGVWSKQEFILECQEGNFPSQICMNVWGEEKVKELDRYKVGDRVKVSFNLGSREYNGRWYTDVRAWRIEPSGMYPADSSAGTTPQAASQGYDYVSSAGSYAAPTGAGVPMPGADDMMSPVEDDLPF